MRTFFFLLVAQAWAAEVCVSKKGELLTTTMSCSQSHRRTRPSGAARSQPSMQELLQDDAYWTREHLEAWARSGLVRVPPDDLGAVRGDDLAQMSLLLEDALSRTASPSRAACPEAAGAACAACLAAGLDGWSAARAASNDGRAHAGASLRHFVPICTTVSAAVSESATTRSEFRMPFLPCFAAVLEHHWPARPAPSSWRRSAGMRSCASSR